MATLVAPAASSAQPSPTNSRIATPNSQDSSKRKRPAGPPPAALLAQSEAGNNQDHVITQLFWAIAHMKSKENEASTAKDLLGYLNVPPGSEVERRLREHFKRNQRIEYDPQGFGGQGSYMFKSPYGVRNGDELLAFLQRQTTAQGIKVGLLKEGWTSAIDTVEELEKEGKLLVTRNKKDSSPKMVWPNDPTLIHEVDNEFRNLWHDVQAPGTAEALRNELLHFGLTPTSQVKKAVAGSGDAKKKKKVPRSGGRTTNTHMAHILKDYSHLRRV